MPPRRTYTAKTPRHRLGPVEPTLRRVIIPRVAIRLVAIVLVSLAFGLPSLAYPYGRDQGIFGVAASIILHGGLPYHDVFDFKPPAIYYTYALIQALLGSAPWACRLADLLWQVATALILARTADRLIGGRAGLFAALIYLICYHSLGFWHTAQPEGFLVLPLLAFVLLISDDARLAPRLHGDSAPAGQQASMAARARWGNPLRFVAAGLFLGIACLFKYTAVTVLPLTLLGCRGDDGSPLRIHRRLVRLLWAALGTALPFGLWSLYALSQGIWTDFYFSEFVFAPEYVASSHPGSAASLVSGVWALLRGFGLPWWCHLSLVAALFGMAMSKQLRARCALPLAGLILAWLGVVAQGKYFPYHMVVLIPWFALLAGAMLDRMSEALTRGAPGSARRVTTAVCGAVVLASTPLAGANWQALAHTRGARDRERWLTRFATSDCNPLASRQLALRIGELTDPDDAIFIWGFSPEVYLLSQRRCATRFIYNLPQRAQFAPKQLQADLLDDLRRRPPVLVAVQRADRMPEVTGNELDSAGALEEIPELAAWLQDNYYAARAVATFQIFLRKTPSLRPTAAATS
jgi:hypothetical protein